jgi:CubicO group peptidase (beta-lactamase class C family)
LFEIGSISKVFTGILLAAEVEAGRVRLDAPARDFLPPGYQLPEKLRGPLKIEHLATHSAGFPSMPARLRSPWRMALAITGFDPHAGYSESDFRADTASFVPEYEPGARMQYSNFSAALAGRSLANKAECDYESLLVSRIAGDLAMIDTVTRYRPDQTDRIAKGHQKARRAGPLMLVYSAPAAELPEPLAGAGGIRSTASDMVRFLKANMKPPDTPLGKAIRRSHQTFAPRTKTRASACSGCGGDRIQRRN